MCLSRTIAMTARDQQAAGERRPVEPDTPDRDLHEDDEVQPGRRRGRAQTPERGSKMPCSSKRPRLTRGRAPRPSQIGFSHGGAPVSAAGRHEAALGR